jgi:uncharacterized membrane protein YhaH (DUF805 family)
MIKCPNCDKAIFDTAVRCRHCKTKLLDGNVIAPLDKAEENQANANKRSNFRSSFELEGLTPQTPLRFNEAVRTCFQKYFDFSGRATRREYWFFYLFIIVFSIFIGIISGISESYVSGSVFSFISSLFYLAVFLPSFSVSVRRLHDTNRSGWMLLIWLIPFFGLLWVGILLCFASDKGTNRFGENPQGILE